jgi:tetratricopeptide (TPR) repeat protein
MKKLLSCSILILFFNLNGFSWANKADSLEHIFATEKNDTLRLNSLIQLGKLYLLSNNPKAEGYARQCIALAKQKRLDALEASGYNLLGTVYYYRDQYTEAIEKYGKAAAIYSILNNNKVIASTYRNIALCYSNLGNYKSAIDYNFKSLKIAEVFNDSSTISAVSNDIGNIFYYQRDFTNAEIHYQKALIIFEKKNDLAGMAMEMNNIGSVNSEIRDYKKALLFFEKAFEIRKKIQDTLGLITSYTNMGLIHSVNEEHDKALEMGFEALKLAELSHSEQAKINSLSHIASTYSVMKSYTKAIEYGERSLKLAENQHDPGNNKEIHDILYKIYEGSHNTDKALYHYKQFIAYRDSLVNKENTKKSIQTEMQYNFNKKQTADSIHNLEKVKLETLKHQQEINQQKTYTYGGIIGFLLMIIVAGVSFRAYRQKQKANKLVNEQKQLIEEKQEEILASIHYARRIQQAILPTEKYIDRSIERLTKKK